MPDQRRSRPRPTPRPSPPAAGPAPRPPAPAEAGGHEAVPPWRYQQHLAEEHGLTIIAEPGWPTAYKRYVLVRRRDSVEQQLVSFTGTLPEAAAFFYRYIHPPSKAQQTVTRGRTRAEQEAAPRRQ